MQQFREDINAGNLEAVSRFYPNLRELLSSDDSWRLAQSLHYRIRDVPIQARTENPLLEIAQLITNDYKLGKLAAHPLASVHMLSIYKEAQQYAKGHDLWLWLSKQGDEHLDARVYGAAIELLAYSGQADLQELEELYQYALETYAGTFAGYHLSPNAVLPDRLEPITLDGMPMTLLQGILTARLLLGDWQNAYMALDTALRLHPTDLPPRFFEIFCYERPLVESYKLFHIACRSLTVTHPRLLTTLLNRILDENPSNKLTASQLQKNLEVLDQALDTVKAYAGAGGDLTKEHVSLMVKAMSNLVIFIPLDYTIDPKTIESYEQHNARIASLAERLVESLVPFLGRRVSSAYHTLIGLAGRARDSELILRAFSRIPECGDSITIVSHRSLITALGLTGNFEAVKIAWESVSAQAEPPVYQDWMVLAKAAGNSKDPKAADFVQGELQKFAVEARIAAAVRLACKARHWTETVNDDLKTLQFDEVGERISSSVSKALSSLVSQHGVKHNFYEEPFKSDYRPTPGLGISREELRAIYDEMTTDPEQPPPSEEVSLAVDDAGYPLAEHRFENWLAINDLLALAEADAREKSKAIEAAIASRGSNQIFEPIKTLDQESKAESGPGREGMAEDGEANISTARENIRRLRGLH